MFGNRYFPERYFGDRYFGGTAMASSGPDFSNDFNNDFAAVAAAPDETLTITSQPVVGYDADVLAGISLESGDPTSTATVTAAIQSGSGTLSGTTAKAMVGGAVLFGDLEIAGTGAHVLRFTATGHTLVDSATITINAGDPPVSDSSARKRRRVAGMVMMRFFGRRH